MDQNDGAPKWGFLGDDADLIRTINEADDAILACVYRVEFIDISPNYVTVHLGVTIARTFKGILKPNERIVIEFPAEVPSQAAERKKMLNTLRDNGIGNLRFCFIRKPKGTSQHYEAEWLDVPKFTSEMNDFLEAYRHRSKSQ